MAIITISRPYGSGGDEVAARVAQILGYRLFDKHLMAEVAADVGLSESEIVDFSERAYKAKNFLDRLLTFIGTPPGQPQTVVQIYTRQRDTTGTEVKAFEALSESRTIEMVRTTIQAAYERGNVVIVGRGGQSILQNQPGVLHVRIAAPLNERVRRIQERSQVNQEEAQKIISQHDKASADYLKRFYQVNWSDPLLYHLLINTGKWDLDAAARFIAEGVHYGFS